ncbi:hypothetical protein JJQ72_12210 [Paenibacillus sp. F411]|uniref:hypothetical protein n=1 Tax=Paenibacillus sp. F411 TaxID=2820239 RepID=UPI001AAFF685|nr:hypothetical protein [Paenibacillus sp. F411]MBO2944736.1 hypothetical protein [Paenibacillus sp. F411]
MKYLKYFYILLVGVTICSASLFSNIDASVRVPDDIRHYANDAGLEEFKKLISEDPIGFGYKDIEEVGQVTLGPGFQINWIDADKFANVKSSLIDVSKPTGQYEFIVLSNGEGKSFLTVERNGGRFRVISAGGDASGLSKSLAKMTSSLASASEHIELALIKDGNVRYLVTNVDGKEVNIPDFTSEKMALMSGMDQNQLWDSDKTISYLKQAQFQNVDPNTDGTRGYPITEKENSRK